MTLATPLTTFLISFLVAVVHSSLPDKRPAYNDRSYHSKSIDELITNLQPLFNNPDLATLFANCLPNTLDTTVKYTTPSPETVSSYDLDSFVITGDIDALWLRDSMNQVIPYIPYSSNDTSLQYLLNGLINRHAKSILIDSYANSFNFDASNPTAGHQTDIRTPPMQAAVFEGKYEIDSLNAFFKLSYWYWQYAGEAALLSFANTNWLKAVKQTLTTIQVMQEDTGRLENPPYLFRRMGTEPLDSLIMQGRGPPCEPNGLTRSLFRPSDDAVTLPYNIPGNAMACVELHHIQSVLIALLSTSKATTDPEEVKIVLNLASSIQSSLCSAIEKYTGNANAVTPYEVDGLGGMYFMDDANVPSLLSLPLLGFISSESKSYQATRSFVLSTDNPFYFKGKFGQGVGGPHVGYNMAWPMAITIQALTSDDDEEIQACLQTLLSTTADQGFMHESFDVQNPYHYTRSWFAWANGLFGELVLHLIATKPYLVIKNDPQSIATAQSFVKTPISVRAQQQPLIK